MSMSLENGTYIIRNQSTKTPIGALEEGKPIPISKVVTLPGGVRAPLWKVTKERDGFYKFTQDGGAAIEINKLLFVDSKIEDPHLTTWKVEHVPQHGDDAYIVTNLKFGGPSLGWVVTEPAPYAQVAVRPLISTPSFPPRFPPNEVFDFIRADDDDVDDK
ncbi:hypothetical protein MD484_g8756, partial [Candolleomyces efflorescens]